jgi:hypothetical protein
LAPRNHQLQLQKQWKILTDAPTNIDLYVCAVGEQKGEEKGRRILLLPLECQRISGM